MPLMIDATTLVSLLQRMEIANTASLSALELMLTAEGDAFDEFATVADHANATFTEAQVELVQRVRELVDEAMNRPCP